MPARNLDPAFAISVGFDASQWAGADLYSRGGDTIIGPTGWGLFEDALVFLNGLGSNQQLGVSLGLAFGDRWTGPVGVGSAYISADDFVVLEHTGGPFSLLSGAGNAAFGFDTAGQSSVSVDGTHRLTATSPWARGLLTAPNLNIDPDGAGAAFSVFDSDAHVVQSVPTMIRWYEEGDADALAPTTNLEALDHSYVVAETVRWGIRLVDGRGHVYTAREEGMGGPVTWISASFRQRLGFSGREVETTDGDIKMLTADNPLPGFIVPQRPIDDIIPGYGAQVEAERLRGGSPVSSEISDWTTFRLSFYLGGRASRINESTHWHRYVLPYLHPGRLVTVYQEWGDPRRARHDRIRTSNDEAYSTLYTEEFEGRRGRLRCFRSTDDQSAFTPNYENTIKLRFKVELLLEERKD